MSLSIASALLLAASRPVEGLRKGFSGYLALRRRLAAALEAKLWPAGKPDDTFVFIAEYTAGEVVFERDSDTYRVSYTDDGVAARIVGEPVKVQVDYVALEKSRRSPVRAVELGPVLGPLVYEAQAAALAKGAGHKYLRRIPTGNPKKPWRYLYSVAAVTGHQHDDHYGEGSKFQVAHGGKAGHFEIVGRDGDKVRVKHDESGHETELTVAALRAMMAREHAHLVDAHRNRLKTNIAAARKHGTSKQVRRLLDQARAHGHDDLASGKGGPFGEGATSITDDLAFREVKRSLERAGKSADPASPQVRSMVEHLREKRLLNTAEAARRLKAGDHRGTLGSLLSAADGGWSEEMHRLAAKAHGLHDGDRHAAAAKAHASVKAGSPQASEAASETARIFFGFQPGQSGLLLDRGARAGEPQSAMRNLRQNAGTGAKRSAPQQLTNAEIEQRRENAQRQRKPEAAVLADDANSQTLDRGANELKAYINRVKSQYPERARFAESLLDWHVAGREGPRPPIPKALHGVRGGTGTARALAVDLMGKLNTGAQHGRLDVGSATVRHGRHKVTREMQQIVQFAHQLGREAFAEAKTEAAKAGGRYVRNVGFAFPMSRRDQAEAFARQYAKPHQKVREGQGAAGAPPTRAQGPALAPGRAKTEPESQAPEAPRGPGMDSPRNASDNLVRRRNEAVRAIEKYRDALTRNAPSHEIEAAREAGLVAKRELGGMRMRDWKRVSQHSSAKASAQQFFSSVEKYAADLAGHRAPTYQDGALEAHLKAGGRTHLIEQTLKQAMLDGDPAQATPAHLKAAIGDVPVHELVRAVVKDRRHLDPDLRRLAYTAGHLAGDPSPDMTPPGQGWPDASTQVVEAAAKKGNQSAQEELDLRRKASRLFGFPHAAGGPSSAHSTAPMAHGHTPKNLTEDLKALRERVGKGDRHAYAELERRAFAMKQLGHGDLDQFEEGGARSSVWGGDRVQGPEGTLYHRRQGIGGQMEWAPVGPDGRTQSFNGKSREALERQHGGPDGFRAHAGRPDEHHFETSEKILARSDRGMVIAEAIRHAAGDGGTPIESGGGHLPIEHLARMAEIHNREARRRDRPKEVVPFHEAMSDEHLNQVVGGAPRVGTPGFDMGAFHNEALARQHAPMMPGRAQAGPVGDGSLSVHKYPDGYRVAHDASGQRVGWIKTKTAAEAAYVALYAQKKAGPFPKDPAKLTDAHREALGEAAEHVKHGIAKRAAQLAALKHAGLKARSVEQATAEAAQRLAAAVPKETPSFTPTADRHDHSKAHKRALRFASKDKVRRTLQGVHHGVGPDGEHEAVATDGHRLIQVPIKHPGDWAGSTRDKRGEALEGSFPNYHQVLAKPDSHDVHDAAHFGKAAKLLADIHRTSGGVGAGVVYSRKGGVAHLGIDLKDPAMPNSGKVLIPVGKTEHPDGEVRLNAQYLHEAVTGAKGAVRVGLRQLRSGEIGLNPISVQREDGEKHTIMPMRP